MLAEKIIADGIAISIHETKGSKKLFVLVPGFLDSKDYVGLVGLANDLQVNGWTVIRIQPYGTWRSAGTLSDYSMTRTLRDVDQIIMYAKKEYGIDKIVVGGHSMGGRIALLTTARKDVAAVVGIMSAPSFNKTKVYDLKKWQTDGFIVNKRDLPEDSSKTIEYKTPYSFAEDSVKYDASNSIANFGKPLLLIVGELDNIIPPATLQETYNNAREPKKLVVIPNIGHNYRHHADQIKIVNAEILRFLKEQNL